MTTSIENFEKANSVTKLKTSPTSFVCIALLAVCAFVVVECWARTLLAEDNVSAVPVAPSLREQKMTESELTLRGQQLYAALQARYKEIAAAHQLPHANGHHKDISDVLAKYIPVGTNFSDAQKILVAANANLADSPPRPARSNDPDYDRYDILGGITLVQANFGNVHVGLAISPDEPGNPNATVKKTESWIGIDAL